MKTVLLRDEIVENVIVLAKDTPYDPGPGISMLTVSDSTRVGPGMRHMAGSNPPTFEDVPVEEDPTGPTTQTDALEQAKSALQLALKAIEDAQALG